jgi:hypothetical protein
MIEFAIAILIVVLISVFLLRLLRSGYEIVPEEERVIIYHLGRFARVAGPGIVLLSRSQDRIQRRFSVRNEPADYFVDGLFVYGIPMGLTLNMWRRYDPVKAANGDEEKLKDLVLFEESERRGHLEVKLRDALVRHIGAFEQGAPLGPTATIIDRILPILPGVPTCAEILAKVQQDLVKILPSLGLFLDVNHPIVITCVHPPEDLLRGFSRDRAAALLRLQFPNLSDSMMVHMLESIEGLEPLRIHEFRQVGNVAGGGAATEARWVEDDTMFRVPLTGASTQSQDRSQNLPENEPAQSAPDPARLMHADLALLKRVPRETAGHKRAA